MKRASRAGGALLALVAVIGSAGCGGTGTLGDRGSAAPASAPAATPGALAANVARALSNGLERLSAELDAAGQVDGGPAFTDAIRRAQAEHAALTAVARAQTGRASAHRTTVLTGGLRQLGEDLALAAASTAPDATAARALARTDAARLATDLRARVERREPGLGARSPRRPALRASAQYRAALALAGDLLRARWATVQGDRRAALAAVADARVAGRGVRPAIPELDRALRDARRAARRGADDELAAARGRAMAAIATTALTRTVHAVARGDAGAARRWVALRDVGPPRSSGGVRDDAARAVEALRLGQISPAAAALSVRRDGLDALQRSATVLVSRSALAGYGRRDAERVQAATIAVGYWSRLAPAYAPLVAPAAAAQARQAFASLAATGGGAPTTWQVDAAATAATGALGAFSAAPLTEAERARRAQQLVRLTSQTISQLCDANAPARRQRGLAGEGATGPSAIARVIADLRPGLSSADSARLAALTPDLQALPQAAGILGEEGAPPAASVPARATELCDRLSATVSDVFPGPWRRLGGDADLDRIEAALQRMQDAAAAGRWGDANRARREAYSIFELGPELRLRAFAPDLAVRLEGLFWASAPDGPNLVDVLAPGTPPALVRQRREATVAALEQARAALDRPRSGSAVVVNSAIVVFREGLEAALILAALAATFAFGGRAWRRPLVLGMLAALPATLVTWFVTTQVVRSFAGYGLAVEAVLDLLALLVLVIILAWFFQRFCWTRFVVRQQARHRRVLALRSSSGPALALALLGFTAIYREGFETVIYLQALRLDAGTGTVLQGVLLGIALTAVLAVLMLRLRRRLPYRTIVVIAASGIALLTVIVAGQAARAAQAAGWLAVTPLDIRVPAWAGPWLGMYPAAQTLIAQVLAAVGVVVLGLAVRARREQRAARRMQLARSRKAKATG